MTPVKKHASIKDKSLIITEADGAHTQVCLSGCVVEAVSAANVSSRKWLCVLNLPQCLYYDCFYLKGKTGIFIKR